MSAPAPPRDAHSRLVAAAKIALPLAGLALLSSLFLLAGDRERPPAPLAPEAQGIAQEQRLSRPVHAGVTARGDAIELAAEVARPDRLDPRRLEAEGLRARLVSPGGSDLTLVAPQGQVDTGTGEAALSGGIRLEGTAEEAGPIEAEAEAIRFDLRAGRAESAGPVRAEAAMGRIEAGAMTAEGDRIEFGEGVRLVLAPPGGSVEGEAEPEGLEPDAAE